MEKLLAFPKEEYELRLKKVQSKMDELDLGCLLVTDPTDLYYLTGLRSGGWCAMPWQTLVVPRKGNPDHITRKLERDIFQQQTWLEDIREGYGDGEDPIALTIKYLKSYDNLKRIGISKGSWFVSPNQLKKIEDAFQDVEFVDTTNLLTDIRLIKSPAEISYIREAARILSIAIPEGVEAAREGCTENDIAAATLFSLVSNGSGTPAWTPFVGTGIRSNLGHVSWERYPVKKGDLVFLEVGAAMYRYHAATMRTISIGEPSSLARQLEEASREAVNAAIAVMKPGATTGEVDEACRSGVIKKGFGEYFNHRAGYSIGAGFKVWIDGPSLMQGGTTVLEPGMVFHVVPELGGVSISETVLITENGNEVLTDIEQKIFVR